MVMAPAELTLDYGEAFQSVMAPSFLRLMLELSETLMQMTQGGWREATRRFENSLESWIEPVGEAVDVLVQCLEPHDHPEMERDLELEDSLLNPLIGHGDRRDQVLQLAAQVVKGEYHVPEDLVAKDSVTPETFPHCILQNAPFRRLFDFHHAHDSGQLSTEFREGHIERAIRAVPDRT